MACVSNGCDGNGSAALSFGAVAWVGCLGVASFGVASFGVGDCREVAKGVVYGENGKGGSGVSRSVGVGGGVGGSFGVVGGSVGLVGGNVGGSVSVVGGGVLVGAAARTDPREMRKSRLRRESRRVGVGQPATRASPGVTGMPPPPHRAVPEAASATAS